MNFSRSVAVLVAISSSFAFATAQTSSPLATLHHARERRIDLKKELKTLLHVRDELMKSSRDFSGHRTKAVQGIDLAIDEIKQAMGGEPH